MSIRNTVVDIAYRFEITENECIRLLQKTIQGVFDRRRPTAAFVTRLEQSALKLHCISSEDDSLASMLRATVDWIPLTAQQTMVTGPPLFGTSSEVFGHLQMDQLRKNTGVSEFTGVICPTGTGLVVLGSSKSEPLMTTERQRREWEPVAAHITSAWRLRTALMSDSNDDSAKGSAITYTPAGMLIDAGAESPTRTTRELLRHAVMHREMARRRCNDELWPELIAGKWTLVDRFESGGQRVVVAHRNEPLAAPYQALSSMERIALERAIAGEASKAIAIDFNVSEATVSRLLSGSLRRLGMRDIADAAQIRVLATAVNTVIGGGNDTLESRLAVMRRSSSIRDSPEKFTRITNAERSILELVITGESYTAIAAKRRTSRHTVTNQLTAIFAKLGVRSRRELIALMQRDVP